MGGKVELVNKITNKHLSSSLNNNKIVENNANYTNYENEQSDQSFNLIVNKITSLPKVTIEVNDIQLNFLLILVHL